MDKKKLEIIKKIYFHGLYKSKYWTQWLKCET